MFQRLQILVFVLTHTGKSSYVAEVLSRLYCSFSQEILNFGKRPFKTYIFVLEFNLKHCKRLHLSYLPLNTTEVL